MMPAGIGLGLLAVSLWRLAVALALILARLGLMALRVLVWTLSAGIIGIAWLLERTPRPRKPIPPAEPNGPTLAQLLAPYTRKPEGTS